MATIGPVMQQLALLSSPLRAEQFLEEIGPRTSDQQRVILNNLDERMLFRV